MKQPHLRPQPDTDQYRLIREYPYSHNGLSIIVPLYFRYDGASIPLIAQIITYSPFHPKIMAAALLHDWLYYSHVTSRKVADKIFRDVLIKNGVSNGKAQLMYKGVRRFGASYYNKHKGLDNE